MAKFKTTELLHDLKTDVERVREAATYMRNTEKGKLVYQPNKEKWSITQILEHLNAYSRFYHPHLNRELSVKNGEPDAWFESGWLGNYFVNSMKPKNVLEIKNKMKAMKAFTFPNSLNVDKVFDEFDAHQKEMLQFLELAKERNINNIRIPLSVTNMVKLKLGDVLRFLTAHEQRHLIQARNTLKQVGVATDKFPVILQVIAPTPA